MEQSELIVTIILAAVSVLAMAVLAYAIRTQNAALVALITPFVGAMETFVKRADVALAPYGDALKPVHDTAEALSGLIDEPTDFLIKLLADATAQNPAALVDALAPIFGKLQELTDGVPQQEEGEPGGAVR